ncbi:MAG TPA: aminotransferase class III-fold pyridoxal phosphate-dependent enzyme, partial [Polyangiaceae bacterium]|nr:aminotransferase class III-fold pyridoxal phosphate-dependent enzyme [Polyangiaceae bacterium]
PQPGFLQRLLELCRMHGALSILDEVMTGCRLAPGGAQELYGLKPDLTCLGKVVGGGMPLAVYGGRRDVMSQVSPLGPVYQAGTLSGNPLSVSAGLATLEQLVPEKYAKLEATSARLANGLSEALEEIGIPGVVQRVGSMLTLFFNEGPVRNWNQAKSSDTRRFGAFHRALTQGGVYWPPSQFEAAFVSFSHSHEDIDLTLHAVKAALGEARSVS